MSTCTSYTRNGYLPQLNHGPQRYTEKLTMPRLFAMEDFISLFLSMPYHLKCFETTNETTPKIHDFILEFHNTKFYFVSLVIYMIK
jgi:hypothetical protein